MASSKKKKNKYHKPHLVKISLDNFEDTIKSNINIAAYREGEEGLMFDGACG